MLTPYTVESLPTLFTQRNCENPHFHCMPDEHGYLTLWPITQMAEALLIALYGQPVVSLNYEQTTLFLEGISMEGEN